MDKYTDYLGIDVSKSTLGVMNSEEKHFQSSNDLKGFREFAKIIPGDSLCIMEVIPNWPQNVAYKSFLFRLYFVKKQNHSYGHAYVFCLIQTKNNSIYSYDIL